MQLDEDRQGEATLMLIDRLRRSRWEERRRHLAIHEAGHAVLAAICPGATVATVTIVGPWAQGQATTTLYHHGTFLEERAGILLGGMMAEARHWRTSLFHLRMEHQRRISGFGPRNDWQIFRSIHEQSGAYMGLEYALSRATAWVEARFSQPHIWKSVIAVAEALLHKGTLSGEEVMAIIARHAPVPTEDSPA